MWRSVSKGVRAQRWPALPGALALLAGIALALRSGGFPIPAAALLTALGFALGGRHGGLCAMLASGGLVVALAGNHGDDRNPPPDLARPVDLVVRVQDPGWRSEVYGWSARGRVLLARQGGRVWQWSEPIVITLDASAAPPPASRYRTTGLLSRSAGFANIPRVAPGPWRLRVKSKRFLAAIAPEEPPWGRLRRRIRSRLRSAFSATGDGPGAALACSLVLGDRTQVDRAQFRALRRLGLMHLLALSGLHVGLVGGLALLMLSRARPWVGLAGAGIAVAAYLWIAGPRPSLVRAALMAWLAIAGLLLHRAPTVLNLLAVSAAVMAAANPLVLHDLSFRLSFAATAGILLLAPRLAARWRWLPGWLALPLATTVAAQLATLPFTLPSFHLLPLFAPIGNLVAVPWASVTLIVSLAVGGVGLTWIELASALGPLLELVATPWRWLTLLPPAWTPVLAPSLGPKGATALALALLALVWWPRWLLPIGAAVLWTVTAAGSETPPRMTVLDVGQGQAVLLQSGTRAVLVDGGGFRNGEVGARVVVPALAALDVGSLTAIALTHPDTDHCRGLVEVADLWPVKSLWSGSTWPSSVCWRQLQRRLAGSSSRHQVGAVLRVGEWQVQVLHPPADFVGEKNDRSMVLRASARGLRVLLPGDLESIGERRLVERWGARNLRSDVLVLAHHGSRTSSTPALLAAVSPSLAIASAGVGNVYGHPATEVVSRVRRSGARVLRTDRDGMVILTALGGGRLDLSLPASPR